MQQRATQPRDGYEIIYNCPQPAPAILLVDYLTAEPAIPMAAYRNFFGAWRLRLVPPDPRANPLNNVSRSDQLPNFRPARPESFPESIKVRTDETPGNTV
jgi:hypothetical protein